jgi:hypothetical protein
MSAKVIAAEKHSAERTRQACLSCKRKKVRCNGEKPVCRTCAQSLLTCCWPIDLAPGLDVRAAASWNETLVARITMLEHKLKSIVSEPHNKDETITAEVEVNFNTVRASSRDTDISSNEVVPRTPNNPIQLPSQSIFSSIIDDFFKYCHNRPYSYFRERTFRQRHSDKKHPIYLLYAFAATAIKFSPQFSTSDRYKLVQPYCDKSWTQLTQYAFLPTSELNITLVQTSSLLSVIDFTRRLPLIINKNSNSI